MTVWLVLPSARPLAEAVACLAAWKERGYHVAVVREDALLQGVEMSIRHRTHPGYAAAVNMLARNVLNNFPAANVVVAGSDDVFPDPRPAAELEAEFVEHFKGTFGISQPNGHHSWSALALDVAWSPWCGRTWIEKTYNGNGPFYDGYFHFWCDRELQLVAEAAGVFWSRLDIVQEHRTWRREIPRPPRPRHLRKAADMHERDRLLFEERQAAGFPGALPEG